MTTTWLIGGATPEAGGKTPEQLNIETLSIRYLNQQADECSIGFFLDIDDDLPDLFTSSNPIDIYRDGTCVFRGDVESPGDNETPESASRSAKLYGLWRAFEQTPWTYTEPDCGIRSDGKISGSITAALQTLIALCPADIQPGTVDIGDDFDLPGDINITCSMISDVIRRLTRLVPGTVVLFDYSTTPLPTCHVLHYDSTSANEITFGETFASISRNHKTNRCDAVNLHYDRQADKVDGDTTTTTISRISSDHYPAELYGRHTYTKSNILVGKTRVRKQAFTVVTKPSPYPGQGFETVFNDKGNALGLLELADIHGGVTRNDTIPDWVYEPDTIMRAGPNGYWDGEWHSFGPNECRWNYNNNWSYFCLCDPWGNDAPYNAWPYLHMVYRYYTVEFRQPDLTNIFFFGYVHCVRAGLGSIPLSAAYNDWSGSVEYWEPDNNATLEDPPTPGAAQAIYNALNTNNLTGNITLPGWYSPKAIRARVVNKSGALINTTPVQDRTYDLDADETRISFGSPKHLTPDEIISLRKAYN